MDKDIRICIIGGGPAGLSAGMYLEQKGYENYTILEKNDRVGGKCWSPCYNGRRYEMGAIMGVPSYYAVHDVEEFCGITHDGPQLNRNYKNRLGKVIEPFEPRKNIRKIPRLLKMKRQLRKFGELLETKYKGYDVNGHRGVAEGRYEGFSAASAKREPVSGVNPNLKDLSLPFSEFCKLNGVELIQDIWIGPFTSFGYGFFDEIPAALVMKYLDVTTALEFVNMKLWTWQDGTQAIYEHVNAKLKHPAVLETEVVRVERPEGKVLVTVRSKDGALTTETFDKLIVTTPLDYFKDYADATAEETELFSKIIHERYCDYIATFEPGKSPNISGYMVDNMVPERLGHAMVYYNRWQHLDKDCPATVYALANHTGSPDVDFDTVMTTMDADMKRVGFPIKEKLFAQEVYYCPHVSAADYAAGWYDRLEALQGCKSTYYAGEIISFGDMEDTCAASKDIIGMFF